MSRAGASETLRGPAFGDVLDRSSASAEVDRAAATLVVEQALSRSEDSWLDPAETRELLAAYGLPVVPERIAEDAAAAVQAAAELGFPAVVKSAAAGAHKTESGGVSLDLEDERPSVGPQTGSDSPSSYSRCSEAEQSFLRVFCRTPVFGPHEHRREKSW